MHWLTMIGIILIAVGTFFSILGQNLDSKKNSKLLNTKNDSLMTQNSDLLSQNTSLLEKIDNYQNDIELKNKKIEKLEKSAQKLIYKPLDKNIKYTIVNELHYYKIKSEQLYEGINFTLEFGSINKVKNTDYIARDLRLIFKEAGFKIPEPRNVTRVDPHLKIYKIPVLIVNPKYEDLAMNITLSLKKYITDLKYVPDPNYKNATLKFQFYGIPEFSEDGTVKYQ